MCFDRPWRDKKDQSVFGVALVNQDRHVDLEWPCLRTGFATRVSTGPGGTKTINVRLEWHWLIKIHTSISTGPGEGQTVKVRLEWPWPVQTHIHANVCKSARSLHRCEGKRGGGPGR